MKNRLKKRNRLTIKQKLNKFLTKEIGNMTGYQKLKKENQWLWAFLQSYVDLHIEHEHPKATDEERKKLVDEKLAYMEKWIKTHETK